MTPKIEQLIFDSRITLLVQATDFSFESLPLGQLELWVKFWVGVICTVLQAKVDFGLRVDNVKSELRGDVLESRTNINVLGSVPISSCKKYPSTVEKSMLEVMFIWC